MPGVTIHDILAQFREEELHNRHDWCREHDNPRYIVDLLKRVTRVSIETMKIVNGLPGLNERVNIS